MIVYPAVMAVDLIAAYAFPLDGIGGVCLFFAGVVGGMWLSDMMGRKVLNDS